MNAVTLNLVYIPSARFALVCNQKIKRIGDPDVTLHQQKLFGN